MSNINQKDPSADKSHRAPNNDFSDSRRRIDSCHHVNRPKKTDSSHQPSIYIDVEKYQKMIDDPRLTDEERDKFILSIWALLMTVVDVGLILRSHPDESNIDC